MTGTVAQEEARSGGSVNSRLLRDPVCWERADDLTERAWHDHWKPLHLGPLPFSARFGQEQERKKEERFFCFCFVGAVFGFQSTANHGEFECSLLRTHTH